MDLSLACVREKPSGKRAQHQKKKLTQRRKGSEEGYMTPQIGNGLCVCTFSCTEVTFSFSVYPPKKRQERPDN
jgi:hypothetical protein